MQIPNDATILKRAKEFCEQNGTTWAIEFTADNFVSRDRIVLDDRRPEAHMLMESSEERIMARFMLEATADREQDIQRWEKDIAEAAAAGNRTLVTRIRRRIVDAKQLIEDSGY